MLNSWSWQILRAGSLRLDGGSMFGILPKIMWSKLSEPDDLNRILLQSNCLLLEDDTGRKVIIETGFGNKFNEKDRAIFAMENRWIGNALAEVDIDPLDITDVVITHLHFDHAGGLTYYDYENDQGAVKTPRSTFPNADIYIQRTEWEDALNHKTTMSSKYMTEHLDRIAPQVQFVDGEAEILPGVEVFPVPGHTWGQQAVLFTDEAGISIVFAGDVLPTTGHAGIRTNMAFDVEPYTNTQTKKALLEDCIVKEWRIMLAHETGQPLCTVERDSEKTDSYTLIQLNS